jgi:hypothetical protein
VQIADSFTLDEKYPIFTTPGGDLRLPQDTDESFKEAIEELAESNLETVHIADIWAASHASNAVVDHRVRQDQWPTDVHHELEPLDRSYINIEPSTLVSAGFAREPYSSHDAPLATDHHTDMYSLPPFAVAYELLQHVLETVNDWMPMLPFGFEGQARMYYATPWQVSNIWLATLNLVLALGARHSSLLSRVGQTVHEGTLENTRYLGRAWSCLHSKILRS